MLHKFHVILFLFLLITYQLFALVNKNVDELISLSDSLKVNNPELSLEYAKEALQIAQLNKNESGRVSALYRIANIYSDKTELEKALDFAEQAREFALRLNLQKDYAEVLIVFGKIYRVLGEYDKGTELLFEALKIMEQENYQIGKANAIAQIGFIHFELRNYDKALEFYSKALTISRAENDSIGIARDLNNMAAAYASMNIFTDFEKNINEAIEVNRKNGNKLWLGVNYFNLGSIYAEKNNYDTAFIFYEKAEKLFLKINNLEKLAKVYIEFSNSYQILGDFDQSLVYTRKALNLARENKLTRIAYFATNQLHRLSLAQNDTIQAYQYSILENQLKDSLDFQYNTTKLSHFEILYDIEKKEHERKLKAQRKDFITQIVIICLVAGIILILLLLLRYRLKVRYTHLKQEKLKDELDFKKREMTTNALSLMKKNEALSEIADKLMEIRNEAVKDETKYAINQISTQLEKVTESNIWDAFEKRFNQVHHDFYNNLHQKFPDLSPAEQRLCAFLKLNMSSKDISELTGQKVESLEKARTRLRKKLGLTNTNINLVTFLSQF